MDRNTAASLRALRLVFARASQLLLAVSTLTGCDDAASTDELGLDHELVGVVGDADAQTRPGASSAAQGDAWAEPLDCDPALDCEARPTCIGVRLYPTECGEDNCDAPIGFCEPAPTCDPTLECEAAPTCVAGGLYPTVCGPDNCDTPSEPCSSDRLRD